MTMPSRSLSLNRPLVVLDLETTGLDPQADRIIEIGGLVLAPRAAPLPFFCLVHPGRPIPATATAVHGITDAHVADRPPFQTIAPWLASLLWGCDLGGFNIKRFDLPFLLAEFTRAGISFPVAGRAVIDVLQIYHTCEPRNLAAALRHYCGREHSGAHSALTDAAATVEILRAQVARYPELPDTVAELHAATTEVDLGGRFRIVAGRIVFGFGRYTGRFLDEVADQDPGYLRWMLEQNFYEDVKNLVSQALLRDVPQY